MTYGFRLATDVTDMRVVGMLKEVEEELNRVVRVRKNVAFHNRRCNK